jgi:hypothetical protein
MVDRGESNGWREEMKNISAMLLVLVSSAAFAWKVPPFSRYESIIERMPFGPGSAESDPGATSGSGSGDAAPGAASMAPRQPTAEERQLAAKVRVSALNVTPAGVVKVGFTDSLANPPVNYYLGVGRSQDGWTVRAADPALGCVALEKGGVRVTLKLGAAAGGKDVAKGAVPKAAGRGKRKKRG